MLFPPPPPSKIQKTLANFLKFHRFQRTPLKTFLLKIFLFILPLIFLMIFVPKQWTLSFIDYKKFFISESINNLKNQKNINIILGDSRSEIGLNGRRLNALNLSIFYSSMIDGYFHLKKIIAQNNQINTLYISYAPTFFTNSLHHIKNIFLINKRYNLLDESDLIIYRKGLMNYGNLKESEINDKYFFLFSYLSKITFGSLLNLTGYITCKIKKNCPDYLEQIKSFVSVSSINQLMQKNPLYIYKNNNISEYLKISLKKIKNLCDKHKIRCIFVVMPLNKDLQFTEDKFFNPYYDFMKKINMPFVPEKIIFLENKYFSDPTHLNTQGEKYYYQIFLKPAFERMGVQVQ